MIDLMLKDAAEKGYSSEDIKGAVIEMLKPYFKNYDMLVQYACDSSLLNVFEFFVRYHYDDKFKSGILEILSCYRKAFDTDKEEFWKILLSTYKQSVENENKIWSVKKRIKARVEGNDLYEKTFELFQHIGNNLEITAKQFVQELYALIRLIYNQETNYEKIIKQDFGVIIQNILDKDMFQEIVVMERPNIKLSDWRNIAYHHTYSIKNEKINCVYGKNRDKSFEIDITELERCTHDIIRSCNIMSIAKTIFILDYTKEVSLVTEIEEAEVRIPILKEQLDIGLLGQQFEMQEVSLDSDAVSVALYDLQEKVDKKERIIHCSQLLYNVWNVWKKENINIDYIDSSGKKVCCVYVEGKVCEKIEKGYEDITYLAKKFEMKYY